MAGFLGSILFLLLFGILFILVLGLSLLARLFGGIGNLWNFLTGKKKTNNTYYRRQQNGYQQQGANQQGGGASANQNDRPHSKGVFSDDEGTYVDFEEVKE